MSVEREYKVTVNGSLFMEFGLLGTVAALDARAALTALFRWLKSAAADEYRIGKTAAIEWDKGRIIYGGHVFCIEEVEPTPVQSPSQQAAD